jgi:hypothetical protein
MRNKKSLIILIVIIAKIFLCLLYLYLRQERMDQDFRDFLYDYARIHYSQSEDFPYSRNEDD